MTFTCPRCRNRLRCPDRMLGLRVRCPSCKRILRFCTVADSDEPPERQLTRPSRVSTAAIFTISPPGSRDFTNVPGRRRRGAPGRRGRERSCHFLTPKQAALRIGGNRTASSTNGLAKV